MGGAGLAALMPMLTPPFAAGAPVNPPLRRVRRSDSAWPSPALWERLRRAVGGRLIKVQSPLAECAAAGGGSCEALFKALKNPYYINSQAGLTQTLGWADAWISVPSAYAVAAAKTTDVVAAVNFARDNNLRLVVKGGGHSYKGTSSAPDSLLVWTRGMDGITLHEAFVGAGCAGAQAPEPTMTVEAGAIWMHVYDAVTTHGGRYIQGGGCVTVGVAGLIQSGGFGSFSKGYGMAAAGLLEAEVVTADGIVRIANACTNPDLFWALKGGGGGSFGVVTKLTLRTHALPAFFGQVTGRIRAGTDAAFRRLIGRFMDFYTRSLCNPHWGERAGFLPDRTLDIAMMFQGLNQQQAAAVWRPFRDWVAESPGDFAVEPVSGLSIRAVPARWLWDPAILRNVPGVVYTDDRPGAPASNVFWAANLGEVGHFMYAYDSIWLPAKL